MSCTGHPCDIVDKSAWQRKGKVSMTAKSFILYPTGVHDRRGGGKDWPPVLSWTLDP